LLYGTVLANPVTKKQYDSFGAAGAGGERRVSIGLPSWISDGIGQWILMALYFFFLIGLVPFALLQFFRVKSSVANSEGLKRK
jgi:hypothetical protein